MSAADQTALGINVATGQRAPCGGDDVNGDTRVDSADIEALTHAIFAEGCAVQATSHH